MSRVIALAHAVALALLVGCATTRPAEPAAASSAPSDEVDGPTSRRLVEGGARLLDVRTPAEYAERHIEGAENAPVDTIATHDFGPKDAPIVVYCRSGQRAARAATLLREKGYTRVYDLGAMSNWGD